MNRSVAESVGVLMNKRPVAVHGASRALSFVVPWWVSFSGSRSTVVQAISRQMAEKTLARKPVVILLMVILFVLRERDIKTSRRINYVLIVGGFRPLGVDQVRCFDSST